MRRGPTWRSIAAVTLALSLCAASPAFGGEAAAADFFRAGRAAYARKDYRAAATAFDAAFREAPHAAVKYNAALAWELAREPARAADAFEAALASGQGLSAEQEKDARARLGRLEDDLARLEVAAPPGTLVSVAHLERAQAPLAAHVAAGDHELVASLPDGGERRRRVRAQVGKVTSVRFAAAAETAAGSTRTDTSADSAAAVTTVDAPSAQRASDGSALRTAGWVTIGFGGASAIAAVALGVAALDARDDWEADNTPGNQETLDRAATLRTWTNVAWVAAGTFAAAGVIMIVVAAEQDSQVTLHVGPAGGALRGAF
jgi:hypothetical protein